MKTQLTDFFILLGRLSIFVAAFVVPGVVMYLWLDASFLSAADSTNTQVVSFEVAKGADLKRVAKALEEKKLVKKWWAVWFIGRLKDYSTKIISGEYELSPSLTPHEILRKLVEGKVFYRTITIPEGTTNREIAKLIAETGLVTLEQAQAGLNDLALISRLSISATSFEGYIFPETYKFTKPISIEEMIIRMVDEGRKRFTDDFIRRAEELRMTYHQVLTLASIIEKESAVAEERPIVSSVFHNRLRSEMRLQSDPTVIYGIPNFDGNLTKEQLETPTEYNTYVFTGLPPTPICNPGIDAIRAALFPAESDYLYFVAKGDGTHQFSATYKEHSEAVNRYQKSARTGLNQKPVPPPVP